MNYRWWFFSASIIAMVLSVVLLWTRGLNYGTDFKGGLKLLYQFKIPTTEGEITEALNRGDLPSFVVQRFGSPQDNNFVVRGDVPQGSQEHFSAPFNQVLQVHFGAEGFLLLKEEFVGPKVGKELRTKGIYAVLWACLIMLIYIGFRFDFYFAPGAIFALIHDVLLTVGIFALTGREVNLTVVAAFLTIVGYSINDTIIIFDRVRENLKKYKNLPLLELIDKSLTQSLVRSIITSLTVFFVVVVLFLRAEGDIQDFAFAMLCGVIAGSYSTIFMASPIYVLLREHGHRFGFKKTAKVAAR